MSNETKLKILLLGPVASGKTTIANFLSNTTENFTGECRPTKGVRIVEFVGHGVKGKGIFQNSAEIELWDCSGDNRYQSCWPSIQHKTDGIVFVYSQASNHQKTDLEMLYGFFVEETNFPESCCLVIKNEFGSEKEGKTSGKFALVPLSELKILKAPPGSECTMTDFGQIHFGMVELNVSKAHISEIETKNTQYEQLLADVWVGIVLTLLLLSCVCCMCSCLLFHKFQQWKRSVLRNNEEPDIGSLPGTHLDCESLPSYTIASGLPTYEEAMQQMKTDGKSDKKPGSVPKEDSNSSAQYEVPQSASKTSMINYLQSFVHEKT